MDLDFWIVDEFIWLNCVVAVDVKPDEDAVLFILEVTDTGFLDTIGGGVCLIGCSI